MLLFLYENGTELESRNSLLRWLLSRNFMLFNHKGDITTLDGTPLKQGDKFTYPGSSISSTEKDIDTLLTKAWTAIDRLSIRSDR